jgi:Uncharacterised nucleotidyltransferase
MPRLDVALDLRLLVRVLRNPQQLQDLSPREFSRAIDAAEQSRLLGWLLAHADAGQVSPECPQWLNDRVTTARARAREYERSIRWEIDRLNRAFLGVGFRWVLLKGAAYVAAALPPGRGRRVADIDVLVPQEHLAKAETALREHGWEFAELDAYDARYYREWMHELPPMVHSERRSVIDLHHAILPQSSRLHPSSARLLERSIPISDDVRVLCPAHMVLHAAAHLFHDGEIAGAIRDVVDLDGLLRCFGNDPEFWSDFVREARALQLTRPAYYAVRYADRLLATPVRSDVVSETSAWAPVSPVRWLMDALVEKTVHGRGTPAAALALYIRSHWLRMPPFLLLRHLLRKSVRRS